MRRMFDFILKLVRWLLVLGLLAVLAAAGYIGWRGWRLYQTASAAQPVGAMYSSISSAEGFATLDELPQTYIDAVISVEDKRFMSHSGIDPIAIARAVWSDIRTRSLAEGGSTITQQLAKNQLFTQEKRLERKAAEIFAAIDIEKTYSKRQIFEMYANTIYFGSGCYGVSDAARKYFGKTPAELTDYEAVLLAGLPNAPSAYSLSSSPELARQRARKVLDAMVECGKLTEPRAEEIYSSAG